MHFKTNKSFPSFYLTSIVVVLIILIAGITIANGHGKATGMVKERMDFMKEMGDASKGIAAMIKGKVAYDAEQLATYAGLISAHSKKLLEYFPEDSQQKPTEALPVIWQNWEEFSNSNQSFQKASDAFVATVEGGDQKAIKKQFAILGKSCKGCHQDFRKKKK